ncbi:MAG: hypothetical protein ABSA33_03885, partial [Candidatus Micrarchaeaceae archaeon]
GLTFFSPATVNMGLRDPRWGRVWENFSEDPLLVQTFGVHVIRAMQGDHPHRPRVFLHKPYLKSDLEAAIYTALKKAVSTG